MNAKPIVAITCFAAGSLAATVFFTSYSTAQIDASSHTYASNSPSPENIFVRYARACSELAQADLDIVLDVNKRIGGAYPESTVQRLQNQVEITKAKLQYELGSNENKKLHDIHLGELEEARKLAELNLASAIVVNKRLAGTVSELEIRRLRLAAKVARLAVARGRDPAAASTPHAHLQWQLDQMQSELLWLQIRTDKLAASR